jgi:anti-anti-sigma factor
MPEQLVIEPLEGGSGFRVSGELDLLTVPQLRDVLRDLSDLERDVVLDVAGVSFVDSSGLGLLIAMARATKARGPSLILRSPSPAVRRLLGIAIPEGVPGLVVEFDRDHA